MASDQPDLSASKAFWASKATDWTALAETVAPTADRFNNPLLDACGLSEGDRVLDLASGAGEPALSAADRVGPGGQVVATDLAPGMLQGLKARGGADRLHLVASDMQRLPFSDRLFDRVCCRFGIMFVPDPVAALCEIRRVLRPGGKTAFVVWETQAEQTMFRALAAAVETAADIRADAHHLQIFRFAGEGVLADLFRMAGFSDVTDTPTGFDSVAPTDKPFWRPQLAMTFGHELRDADPALLARIDEAVAAWLDRNARGPKGYTLSARVRIVAGTA